MHNLRAPSWFWANRYVNDAMKTRILRHENENLAHGAASAILRPLGHRFFLVKDQVLVKPRTVFRNPDFRDSLVRNRERRREWPIRGPLTLRNSATIFVAAFSLTYARLYARHKQKRVLGVCALLVFSLLSAAIWSHERRETKISLQAETIAVGVGGSIVAVPPGAAGILLPGTRVIAGVAGASSYVTEQNRWLQEGSVPSIPELTKSSMVRDALLDLHDLTRQYGVTVAGWTPQWRYVWPRDSALAATAFAQTGHFAEAEQIIAFLQRVQPQSGLLQARYLPDGSGVPDSRGVQTDGLGWVLWGTWQVAQELPAGKRQDFVTRNRALIDRAVRAALVLLDNKNSLPPSSSDYWEVKENKLTLATASMILAGLSSAHFLYLLLQEPTLAVETQDSAKRLANAIKRRFAPDDYPRDLGGSAKSVDLGVSFLLPPFVPTQDSNIAAVWRQSALHMRRPAGGLAPGGSWRNDGVSWTTSTSSFAITCAYVDQRAITLKWLNWLDQHRTAAGSIPEKVIYDGQPASVAPLAWSAAAVIIAISKLSQD